MSPEEKIQELEDKLNTISKIFGENLFTIFTAMTFDSHCNMKDYITMRDLLGVKGTITMAEAEAHEDFKGNAQTLYEIYMKEIYDSTIKHCMHSEGGFNHYHFREMMIKNAINLMMSPMNDRNVSRNEIANILGDF